jgi:DNA polymerase V
MKLKDIPVIDLFAGPGGLGEGFSSATEDAFRILVSAEKDQFAYQTLRLRAYYRLLLRTAQDKLSIYLDFCNGNRDTPWDGTTQDLWRQSGEEAKLIELGTEYGNADLDWAIQQKLNPEMPWVLIGGPPCQAYSLVGNVVAGLKARQTWQLKMFNNAFGCCSELITTAHCQCLRNKRLVLLNVNNQHPPSTSNNKNKYKTKSNLRYTADPRQNHEFWMQSMNVISLSSYQPRSTKPLNFAALWSDNLELPILEPQQQLSSLELPLFTSKVPAGFPSPADDHLEATIDLNQHCISNPPATFFVKVKGHSMTGAGINDGDMLVVDRSLRPNNNSIVVAVIDGEVTVKALDTATDEIWLRSKNPDYPDFQIKEGMELHIWGVVKNVIRSLPV